ncbi:MULTISPECIES: TipAS antibiotic-recognition domain-containing protein [unclassified Oscillibacter]|uniref:TipAS antibiotic-recognition domain-containing protein n=1 Tax=unclassified Oscillibacter TaxID=2629304 RepID=UPI0025F041DC|nr:MULTISPECIES: TipAS antibiotic-recognition domain-containing protein [unclassified Oscillibacter]
MADYIGASGEQAGTDRLAQAFANLAPENDPACPEAQALVEKWQAHMAAYHGGCDREKLRNMGQLYGADDRFAETLDSYGTGTAHYMGEAIMKYLGE